jgi:hypothetical protein
VADQNSRGGLLLGFVALAAVAYMVFALTQWAYEAVFPDNNVISLSAFFAPPQATAETPTSPDPIERLHIKGQVHQQGKPLSSGTAKITVERLTQPGILQHVKNDQRDLSFRQTTTVPVSNGSFDLVSSPALVQLNKGDRLQVTAEVWNVDQARSLGTESVHLNVKSQEITKRFQYGSLVVLAISAILFFWAFTGSLTDRRKNRAAIMFSYFVLFVCLAIPLAIPLFVPVMFPEAMEAMKHTPVGILVTRIEYDGADEPQPEWALNIGGYATEEQAAPPNGPNRPTVESNQTVQPDASEPPNTRVPGDDRTPVDTDAAREPTIAPGTRMTGARDAEASRQSSGAPTNADKPDVPTTSSVEEAAAITAVRGGLVIPLYVILLSIVGGAINMTRQVPKYQHDIELLEQQQESVTGRVVTQMLSDVGDVTGTAIQTVNVIKTLTKVIRP